MDTLFKIYNVVYPLVGDEYDKQKYPQK